MTTGLSVIIPAFNEADSIARSVQSAWDCGAAEVVVADGGSTDQTPELAARHGARVLAVTRGRAGQQNAGAAIATGDVLLFLHADNWLAGDIAAQIHFALADPRRVHGAFCQRIDAAGLVYRLLERGNAARVRWLGLPYGDQAIFVRRAAFQIAGGFPDVPIMEDVILMQRLRKKSWPVLLAGPVHVSARRWQQYGAIRQTLRNWALLAGFACGVPLSVMARYYRPHAVP